MHTDRLLKLADHLEQVVDPTPELFDMTVWSDDRDCGTACCALGHACSITDLQAAGLELAPFTGIPRWLPGGDRLSMVDGYGAAVGVFGISYGYADWLFDPTLYPDPNEITPLDVARRIRELVATAA